MTNFRDYLTNTIAEVVKLRKTKKEAKNLISV